MDQNIATGIEWLVAIAAGVGWEVVDWGGTLVLLSSQNCYELQTNYQLKCEHSKERSIIARYSALVPLTKVCKAPH